VEEIYSRISKVPAVRIRIPQGILKMDTFFQGMLPHLSRESNFGIVHGFAGYVKSKNYFTPVVLKIQFLCREEN
jgi:hypothetical protein